MQDAVYTPNSWHPPGIKLTKNDCPSEEKAATIRDAQRWYRSTEASLIYRANLMRPDLAYAVSKLCRLERRMRRSSNAYFAKYLAGTADVGLLYQAGN